MTAHPAALVLAAHQRLGFTRSATDPATCDCGWRGQLCDHPAHLAEVLDRAGLLAAGSTVTVEEAPEGDPGMEATQAWFRNGGC